MSQSFRSKHLLALQIDNGVTQIAELRVRAKSISVIQSFSLLTPAGTVEDDGTLLPLQAGDCHYCPKGHTHSLINNSDEDLVFFAVVPVQ